MKKTVILLCAALLLFACSKKEVKPVSIESKTSVEAFTLADTIKNAFVKKDTETVQRNTTPEGYQDVMANTKPYDSVELSFTPRWVDIDGSQVTLNVSWKSTWTVSGKKLEDRGMAVFRMDGRPLKLTKIVRGNPFVVPREE
jgi:uncharacterized protein YcfL